MPWGQKVSPHHRGRRKTHFVVRTSTIFGADVHDPKGFWKTLYKKSLRWFFGLPRTCKPWIPNRGSRFVTKQGLSGPVLRDTARLSQRYPPIARYVVFGASTWPIGCDTPPPPFLSVSPVESMRSGGAIPPPRKGYLSDTGAIPYENKANGCDTPLCDTISKRYCAIGGGISHWAAKSRG